MLYCKTIGLHTGFGMRHIFVLFFMLGIWITAAKTQEIPSNGKNVTHIPIEYGRVLLENRLSRILRTLVTNKMEEARRHFYHPPNGLGLHQPIDPLYLHPFSIVLNDAQGFLNVSMKKISIHGLGNFELVDIAANWQDLDASVLMRFPAVKIKAIYKLKSFLNAPIAEATSEDGIFQAAVDGLAAWMGKVESSESPSRQNVSVMSLSQRAVSLHWEKINYTFSSFSKRTGKMLSNESVLLNDVSIKVMEKLRRIVEERLEQTISSVIGRTKELNSDILLDDYAAESLFSADSSFRKPVGHSVHKRQVPCENGDVLDEYVDTLLRFARRLIRFSRSVTVPNITAKVEDQINVFSYGGRLLGITNISRRKSPYVRCTNDSITLGLVLSVEDVRITSRYRVLLDYTLLFNGEADVRISEIVVLVQITQTMVNGEFSQRLDRLKVGKLGKITIRLRGLGNLTSATAMFLNNEINKPHQRATIIRTVETQGIDIANQLLTNLNIPILSLI